MTVQEYGLKLCSTHGCRVHNLDRQVSILVSDLERTECRNAMLFEDMKISRLVTHAQQVEDDKLRK